MALEDLAKALASSLEQAKLVPGSAASIIPQDFKPTTELSVKFNGRSLELGNLLRSSECKSAPSISFTAEVSRTIGIFPRGCLNRLGWCYVASIVPAPPR